jgi:hypothetical protein
MLLNKMKSLMAKALEYNVAEAAMDYYNAAPAEVELDDLAMDISIHAVDFVEGAILQRLREGKSAGEALNLPEGIAVAVKQCYLELPYEEAEEAIRGAIQTLKGHALLNIL